MIAKLLDEYEAEQLTIPAVVGQGEQLAISALEKIANPIKHLQDEAEKEGVNLNGYMAIEITKNAIFYKEIARKALEEIANLIKNM